MLMTKVIIPVDVNVAENAANFSHCGTVAEGLPPRYSVMGSNLVLAPNVHTLILD